MAAMTDAQQRASHAKDAAPAAAVIVFPGSNGDRDLFEALELAGFVPRYVAAHDELPDDVALVGLPGGFSYGDYWRAGMLASRARSLQGLPRILARGGLVVGICNGFQILVEAGWLPGALTYNTPPRFLHRYVDVRVTEAAAASQSPWFRGLPQGTRLRLPMANGEGCYTHPGGADAVKARVPLVYEQNPNGSLGDAAALLDDSGQILGIMPHPERACDKLLGSASGALLFGAAWRHFAGNGGRA
jgi:phosphoribosylformylglycinamidine synthase